VDMSARCPLPLCRQVALRSPLVFYFTRDTEMVPLVGHDSRPWFDWLGTGSASGCAAGAGHLGASAPESKNNYVFNPLEEF
jgi:hypothetical protein